MIGRNNQQVQGSTKFGSSEKFAGANREPVKTPRRIKMRLFVSSALATITMFVFAATASAVAFDFENVTGGSGAFGAVLPGDNITAELWINTGASSVQAWFLEVQHGGGGTATAASIEPFLFVGGIVGTPLGSPGINNYGGGSASGQFAITVSPPNGFAAGNFFKFGSISLTAGTEDIKLAISEAGGAVGGPGGVDLVAEGLVTFDVIPVPEPTTALLVGLGLVGLGVAGRRS
jgi:hypothetical protein